MFLVHEGPTSWIVAGVASATLIVLAVIIAAFAG